MGSDHNGQIKDVINTHLLQTMHRRACFGTRIAACAKCESCQSDTSCLEEKQVYPFITQKHFLNE
jgi:hypothetical protein